jgi:hypothetical protein
MKKLTVLAMLFAAASAFAQARRPVAQDFASDSQTVPVVANVTGVGGAAFISYLAIFNPTPASYSVTASFYDAGGVKHDAMINLAPGELKTYTNVLDSLYRLSGGGALVLTAPESAGGQHNNRFIVNSEIRSGRYSTLVPVLEFPGTNTQSFAAGVSVDATSRTNIGCFNQAGVANKITASIFSNGGQPAGTAELNLPANGWGQTSVNTIVSNGYVRFVPTEDAACYAVVVDNSTNDGRLISAVEYRP